MSAVGEESRMVLWSGKALDRNLRRHGSSLVDDFWGFTVQFSTGVYGVGYGWGWGQVWGSGEG